MKWTKKEIEGEMELAKVIGEYPAYFTVATAKVIKKIMHYAIIAILAPICFCIGAGFGIYHRFTKYEPWFIK